MLSADRDFCFLWSAVIQEALNKFRLFFPGCSFATLYRMGLPRSLLQARDPSLRGHEWLRDSAGKQGTWQTVVDDVMDGFRDTTTTNSNTVALY